jgi:phenylacetate-CoA ligase
MALKRKPDYFDELETMSAENRAQYQSEKLFATVRYAYAHAPAVKKMLDRAGIKPFDIRTVKDLEKLPITRKTDLIELQKTDPPYGGFLMVPPEEVDRVFISPGPVYEPIQTASIKWFAKAFWAAGFRKGDIVVNTFTYHLSPAGILFHEALRDCGTTVVPTGVGNTEIQVRTMLDLKVTGFVGTPSFLMTVIKKAEETGYNFKKDFAVRRAWFTGEMLPPSLRRTLEDDYGIDTYQCYAVTEPGGALAYECREKKGMHLMDEYAIEIIDPQTGKQLAPGEVGEIAVTPLHNKNWGIIRFGTGDLSSITTEPCPCGRTSYRLTGILGRAGDAVKVRGMFVVGRQVEGVLAGFPEISTYQIIVSRPAQRDEITFRIELKDETADKEKLAEEVNKKFQSACVLKADRIDFVPKGAIPEDQKTKIKDARVWK